MTDTSAVTGATCGLCGKGIVPDFPARPDTYIHRDTEDEDCMPSDWTDCLNCSTADEHDHVCQPPCSCCYEPADTPRHALCPNPNCSLTGRLLGSGELYKCDNQHFWKARQ